MAKAGQGSIPGIDFASIKAGGKSIDELTGRFQYLGKRSKVNGQYFV